MAAQLCTHDRSSKAQGHRSRERESPFPMIPVDEAIGQVLKQAMPLEAVAMKLGDIPPGELAHLGVLRAR